MRLKITLILTFLCLIILTSTFPLASSQTIQLLDPSSIPRFVNQLSQAPSIFVANNLTDNSGVLVKQEYTVKVSEFTQQILPLTDVAGKSTGFSPTKVWGYVGEARDSITGKALGSVGSTPGSTFEVIQGIPVQVKWVNDLVDSNGKPLSYMLPVDPTLHWANPNNMPMKDTSITAPTFPPGYTEMQAPVPIVTHLHGGEVQSNFDGNPAAWWTSDEKHGPAYSTVTESETNSAVYLYPNTQEPVTLWYHDHALGLTRLNVMSVLAGFYIIRNPDDPIEKILPKGEYEI